MSSIDLRLLKENFEKFLNEKRNLRELWSEPDDDYYINRDKYLEASVKIPYGDGTKYSWIDIWYEPIWNDDDEVISINIVDTDPPEEYFSEEHEKQIIDIIVKELNYRNNNPEKFVWDVPNSSSQAIYNGIAVDLRPKSSIKENRFNNIRDIEDLQYPGKLKLSDGTVLTNPLLYVKYNAIYDRTDKYPSIDLKEVIRMGTKEEDFDENLLPLLTDEQQEKIIDILIDVEENSDVESDDSDIQSDYDYYYKHEWDAARETINKMEESIKRKKG